MKPQLDALPGLETRVVDAPAAARQLWLEVRQGNVAARAPLAITARLKRSVLPSTRR